MGTNEMNWTPPTHDIDITDPNEQQAFLAFVDTMDLDILQPLITTFIYQLRDDATTDEFAVRLSMKLSRGNLHQHMFDELVDTFLSVFSRRPYRSLDN